MSNPSNDNGPVAVFTTYLIGIVLGVLLLALIVLFGWNVGVVGAAAALGHTVAQVSYGTSIGIAVVIFVLRARQPHSD